jgi:TolB-like protein/class 3 adenylate cyclase/Flp pilus assembly protein TadD
MASDSLSGKLAVILHADVARSTRMVQTDEHLAHERIQATFRKFGEQIKRYSGKVLEQRGDALLAAFERPSNAVAAALAFQEIQADYLSALGDDLKPEVRVGIAMGEVVIADNTITGAGVVLAQRIEQLAGPGELFISSAVQESLSKRLPVVFAKMGDKTLKGFDDPVRVFGVRLKPGESITPPTSKEKSATHKEKTKILSIAVVALMALGLTFYFFSIDRLQTDRTSSDQLPLPLSDKPSIAVLPFVNLSGDSEQDHLSDGVSASIIAALSKLNGLTVIARSSSFSLESSSMTVQEIGGDLGAQYILEGDVQRSGERLRVTAQLVDAQKGRQLWAEKFDRELSEIFSLQDKITQEIISTLQIHLTSVEQKNLPGSTPASFEAYDLFLKGQKVSVNFSEDSIAQAVSLYREAIRIDPDYAHAYAALAVARIRQFLQGFTDTPARMQDRALELANKAATLDPGSHQIQWSLGYIHLYRKEFEEALVAAERAVSFSPNYADGYALLALVKNNLGQAEDVIPLIEKAKRLNPHYTWDYIYQLGRAYYALGEYEKAVSHLVRAIERNESAGYPRLFLAASYVNLGLIDEAEWEITQMQMAHPEYTRPHLQKTVPIGNKQLFDRFFRDLQKAGLTK